MKGASKCTERVKAHRKTLKKKFAGVELRASLDPISELVLAILSRDVPFRVAHEVLERLRSQVVDFNELRVIPSHELAELINDQTRYRLKADDLNRALNFVFAREFDVTLEPLRALNKKEAIAYLDEVEGLEAYSRASIRLHVLGQHAVPLDAAMWARARELELIDPECPLAEAQGFLERQIPADDGAEFVAMLFEDSWASWGDAVAADEVEPIVSVPREIKSSHMLAHVSGVAPIGATSLSGDPDAGLVVDLEEPMLDDRGAVEPVEAVAGSDASENAGGKGKAARKTRTAKQTKAKTSPATKTKTKAKAKATTAAKRTTKAITKKSVTKAKTTAAKTTAAKRTSTKAKPTKSKATKSAAKKTKKAAKRA